MRSANASVFDGRGFGGSRVSSGSAPRRAFNRRRPRRPAKLVLLIPRQHGARAPSMLLQSGESCCWRASCKGLGGRVPVGSPPKSPRCRGPSHPGYTGQKHPGNSGPRNSRKWEIPGKFLSKSRSSPLGPAPKPALSACQNAKTVLQTGPPAPGGRKSHQNRRPGPSLRERLADLSSLQKLPKPPHKIRKTHTKSHNNTPETRPPRAASPPARGKNATAKYAK